MMNESLFWMTKLDGVLQCRQRKLCAHVVRECPTKDSSRVEVEDYRLVHPASVEIGFAIQTPSIA